jgi:signal transduction histidine kinase/ActR/RegA family two-component response regulator/HAMP domain-containing protein
MKKRNLGLQVYIGAAFGVLILVSMLVLAGVLSEIAKREVSRLATSNIENLSVQMARELSSGMDDFARTVQLQAARAVYRDPNASPERMRTALDDFVKTRPEFSFISVVDVETAKVIAANGGIFEGGSAKGRPVFEQGKLGRFVGDVHEAVRLAELLPNPDNGEPLRFLDVAAPVTDTNGHTFRVLGAHISWQWANSIRDSVLGPLKERRDVEILLVDTAGKVVLAPNRTIPVGSALTQIARQIPSPQGSIITWSDGQQYLTTLVPTVPKGDFPGFGWKVVARQPTATAFASVNTLRQGFFTGAVLIALISAFIAWFVAGRILLPVRRLAASASQLSSGAAPAQDVPSNIGEVAVMQKELLRLVTEGNRHSQSAQLREHQFMALAESLPHVVWQADPEGVVEYHNAKWDKELGLSSIRRLDQLSELVHEADRPMFDDAWHASRASGNDFVCTVRLPHEATGRHEWHKIRARAVPGKDGRPSRWVGTLTNINEAVNQAERTELALTKEREAREEAERVTVMKDEFLATLSHELRTPLNAISGWGEILARHERRDELVTSAAEVIMRNVNLQASLIDDLLDMSAIFAGKASLDRQALDIGTLVSGVALSHKALAAQKNVTLSCAINSSGLLIDADERRIIQVFTNLVSNAVKFSDPGGKVEISLEAVTDHVCVAVKDYGCGISSGFLPHVFDRFRQQDASSTRRRGGLGLGLAIAASLIKLHGGTIEADSAGPAKGAIFTVRLPLAADGGQRSGERQAEKCRRQLASASLSGLNILVTDDDEDARLAAQALLRTLGASVSVAASASEALQLLDRQNFDLLVCDIGMPGMDGYELIRKYRQRSSTGKDAAMPAIALTGFAMKKDQKAALQAGFDAHVAKPISVQKLIDAIGAVRDGRAGVDA